MTAGTRATRVRRWTGARGMRVIVRGVCCAAALGTANRTTSDRLDDTGAWPGDGIPSTTTRTADSAWRGG